MVNVGLIKLCIEKSGTFSMRLSSASIALDIRVAGDGDTVVIRGTVKSAATSPMFKPMIEK